MLGFKVHLIPDIKEAWSFSTTWISLAIGAFSQLPDDKQLAFLSMFGLTPSTAAGVAVAVWLIGRMTVVERK